MLQIKVYYFNDTGSRHASRRQRGLQCDFQCLPMCDWAPSGMSLRHSLWMNLTLIGQQNGNGVALASRLFVVDNELRCQFINYYDILYLF